MDYPSVIAYFVALAALTASPGPIMAVVIARAAGRDGQGAMAFAAGLCLGDVLAVLAVAAGLGFWAQTQPAWFALVKYVGIAYLLWLAVGMWNARAETAEIHKSGKLASFGAGLAVCLGNPSTILIHMLLLPSIAPAGVTSLQQMMQIALIVLSAVGLVFFGTILLARQLNRALPASASPILFSRITAAVIAVTSVWMIAA